MTKLYYGVTLKKMSYWFVLAVCLSISVFLLCDDMKYI